MAKVLMLWPATAGVRIGSAEASRLAALGVTNASLLRDDESVGLVLEGWAFDPASSAREIAGLVGGEADCRVLLTALDLAVSDANTIGGPL
jgi:hypothetical protein